MCNFVELIENCDLVCAPRECWKWLEPAMASFGVRGTEGGRRRRDGFVPAPREHFFFLLLSEFNNQKKKKKRVISAMLAYELQYWFTLQTPGSGADDQERGRSERCLEQAPVSCISFSNCAKVQRPCAELKKPALFLLPWFKKIIIKNAHSYPCINRGPKAGGRQSLAVPLATHCTSSSPSYMEAMPPPLTLLPLAVEERRARAGQGDIPAAAWMRELLAAAFGRWGGARMLAWASSGLSGRTPAESKPFLPPAHKPGRSSGVGGNT